MTRVGAAAWPARVQSAKPLSEKFHGGLVVRIWCFHYHGQGSVPGQETEIPQASKHGQKKKSSLKSLIV